MRTQSELVVGVNGLSVGPLVGGRDVECVGGSAHGIADVFVGRPAEGAGEEGEVRWGGEVEGGEVEGAVVGEEGAEGLRLREVGDCFGEGGCCVGFVGRGEGERESGVWGVGGGEVD